MKLATYLSMALLLAGLTAGALGRGEEKQDAKISVEEFRAKLKLDDSPLPGGGQLQMSYADVVEKVLPSVVTIQVYGSGKPLAFQGGEMPDMDQIPPEFRRFFHRWFGMPEEGDEEDNAEGEDSRPAPRRNAPKGQAPSRVPERPDGIGSGIIISSDGYILTNNHVVEDSSKLEVAIDINGAKHSYEAKVIGRDKLTDVALVKIDAKGLPQATLGNSGNLRVGDIVLAAGSPLELEHSVSQGIVSAMGRRSVGVLPRQGRLAGIEDFIQTDAAINMGNSGGPLMDAMGRVIGINTAIASRTGMNAGIGFAIPISMAMKIVEDLIDDGMVQRGFLGIGISDLDTLTARDLGLNDMSGAVVTMVGEDSPAEKAGLEVGDVIVSVDGARVTDSSDLRLIVSSHRPDSSVALEVMRGKNKTTLNAKLGVMDEKALAAAGQEGFMPRAAPKVAQDEFLKGVTVQDISPALEKRYDIEKGLSGVVVTQVDPESSAAAVGLQEGDVIQAVNRTPVKSTEDAKAQTKGKNGTAFLKVHRKGDTLLLVVRD